MLEHRTVSIMVLFIRNPGGKFEDIKREDLVLLPMSFSILRALPLEGMESSSLNLPPFLSVNNITMGG